MAEMSTSPAQPPSGPSSVTPTTGGPSAPVQRKKVPVNIFNNRKKPVKRPTQQTHNTAAPKQLANGVAQQAHQLQHPARTNGTNGKPEDDPDTYTDYPILISRSAFNRGTQHHVLRFHSKSDVNPYDDKQFVRPVRLHRRYAGEKLETADHSDPPSGADDKDREHIAIKKAEREAEREANKALIAPTGDAGKKPMKKKPHKKVEDVYYDENNPRHKARAQLRYEEARPWHLEDDDAKNAWVGSYEQPLSESSVLFVVDGPGFTMVPVEKWYKMQAAHRLDAKVDSEQVEKQMSAKFKSARWFLGTQATNDEVRKRAAEEIRARHQSVKRSRDVDSDEDMAPVKNEDYRADVDEIDFEFNDEFQDDDEGFVFGDAGDEEAKEVEKKIRMEMREANLAGTGVKDEDKDWDEEEQEEKRAELEKKQKEKRLRRQLRKKEARQEYASDDSDGNKYESASDSEEDSEEERERLEEERKKEEARKANEDKSGASTRGTSTPTGRPVKRPNATLKRDADLSELSGNESSRKKTKLNGRAASPSAPRGARSLSPDAAKTGLSRTGKGEAGSGSDTDASRVGRTKLRLKSSRPASPENLSPSGSRAVSPSGSRAQSPKHAGAAASPPKPASALPFPSLEDVKLAIPAGGIGLSDLVMLFRDRVSGRNQEFIALVKQAARQDPATKKIMQKPANE